MSHRQGHEPSWEKSYIAYPGKENRSNIHEWVMALIINEMCLFFVTICAMPRGSTPQGRSRINSA